MLYRASKQIADLQAFAKILVREKVHRFKKCDSRLYYYLYTASYLQWRLFSFLHFLAVAKVISSVNLSVVLRASIIRCYFSELGF